MRKNKKVHILFICMGNICRSPTAEGVFRYIVQTEGLDDWIKTDSAGTHAYHVGEPPDLRAQHTALAHGIDLSDLRARKAVKDDFEQFEYLLAMDNDNYSILQQLAPDGYDDKLKLFLDFSDDFTETEVPDPYYGGELGFEHVFNLVQSASYGLLADIKNRFG